MNPGLYLLLGVVLAGFVLVLLRGWIRHRERQTIFYASERAESALADELRQQLERREKDLVALRSELSQSTTAFAAAEARREAAEKLLTEQRHLHEVALQELRQAQDRAIADLRDAFKALSSDALRQTQPEFLRLANETLAKFQESARGDLAQRQQSIATLVKPLEEQLKTYQQRLQQSETNQSTALGEVRQHLESLVQQSQSLSNETLQLRRVLGSSQTRGRWGEETLRRVVEAAGMSAHCDFSEQTVSGDSKPDLIVRLPGDRIIIVDAKVPDLDFLEAMDASDAVTRAEALAVHATKLKATIKALGERDYPGEFSNALDYVVLFVPAESLFSAALEGDRDLIVWAAHRQIMLATPASLIALLRSVSVTWQQHAQTENARFIGAAAQELFARVTKFTEHFERIRSGLDRANNAFNDAVGSYERMVRPSGEKLLRLGGGTTVKELPEVPALDGVLRLPPET
jgi:DNA recombination protein RmuC